jgi:hypothetical protein
MPQQSPRATDCAFPTPRTIVMGKGREACQSCDLLTQQALEITIHDREPLGCSQFPVRLDLRS